MSSTRRGGLRSEADFYKTPAFCVHRLLEELELPGGVWLEPCAGDGAIVEAVQQVRPSDIAWRMLELREECSQDLSDVWAGSFRILDFLETPIDEILRFTEGKAKVCITNPPFRLAEEFLLKCLEVSEIVVFLLRLNFYGSQKRMPIFRKHAPDIFVLPNRPCFDERGSDSCEYAWFVFKPLEPGRKFGTIRMLALTPAKERATPKISPLIRQQKSATSDPKPEGGSDGQRGDDVQPLQTVGAQC